jgi:hypothetical protein
MLPSVIVEIWPAMKPSLIILMGQDRLTAPRTVSVELQKTVRIRMAGGQVRLHINCVISG